MEIRSSRGLTPLMRAAAIGQLDTVRELLEEGEAVDERGPRDSTALMYAAGGGHLEVVRALVEHGADVFAREAGGWNALAHAEEDSENDIVIYLQRVMREREEPRAGFAR